MKLSTVKSALEAVGMRLFQFQGNSTRKIFVGKTHQFRKGEYLGKRWVIEKSTETVREKNPSYTGGNPVSAGVFEPKYYEYERVVEEKVYNN